MVARKICEKLCTCPRGKTIRNINNIAQQLKSFLTNIAHIDPEWKNKFFSSINVASRVDEKCFQCELAF